MDLPGKYGYGTLFGFSGLDGENCHDDDFIAMTMPQPVSLRFDEPDPVTLCFPVETRTMDYILSDAVRCGDLLILFADNSTVAGRSGIPAGLFSQNGQSESLGEGTSIIETEKHCYALIERDGRFAFCRGRTREEALGFAEKGLGLDLDALERKKLDYYRAMPECPDKRFEQLYYKCLSVNKVNVYSPQNGFDCLWTTPDRLPHRQMWLWDSMFHAMAMVNYNTNLAKDAILAVLEAQHEDGFIPHMMKSKTVTSSITQPQVIAWAALEVYKKTGDRAFLEKVSGKAAAFLLWFCKNRDLNGNCLLEWKTDFENTHCRCDESGMDNSPRFDTTERLDAIDASCFMVHDCRAMAEIYSILGDEENSAVFGKIADNTAQKINELLWDDETGAYCDREFSGRLTGVLSCCSFLPLFAGVCDESRAERLAALLRDEARFGTPLPVPSISRDNPDYGTDMWRGGVWLNFNYFIIKGLRQYGFDALADEIKEKTLESVIKFFNESGNIYEFYDPEDRVLPLKMNRKGLQPPVPDYRLKYHAITDFNWSACFTYLMILDR